MVSFFLNSFDVVIDVQATSIHERDEDEDECNPVLISLLLCNSSEICRSRMYIDENGSDDITTFQFIYTSLVSKYDFETKIETWLCESTNYTNDVIFPVEDHVQLLWIEFMNRFQYCNHINQYFDGETGECLCKSDKLCRYVSPTNLSSRFTTNVLPIGLLVLFGIAIVMGIKEHRQLLREFTTTNKLLHHQQQQHPNNNINDHFNGITIDTNSTIPSSSQQQSLSIYPSTSR